MTNKLEQLKTMTDVVADTGDIGSIAKYQPLDATTNPSLLYKAAQQPEYRELMLSAIENAKGDIAVACDHLAVAVGKEILELIPGRISTEVDAHLSFDKDATVEKARELMGLYADAGISADRILIKIAATWEGIEAARELEQEGINCNLTLLFGFAQAVACADAGVTLISPFVGRILDWYKAKAPADTVFTAANDPGVLSVTRIYNYFKQHDYKTIVMGASFRNIGEIEGLAGCDRLTISPALLDELAADSGDLTRQLTPDNLGENQPRLSFAESDFRFALNEDAMATEKLAEGIRNFATDQRNLEKLLSDLAASR